MRSSWCGSPLCSLDCGLRVADENELQPPAPDQGEECQYDDAGVNRQAQAPFQHDARPENGQEACVEYASEDRDEQILPEG